MLYFSKKQLVLKSIKNNGQYEEALEHIYTLMQKRIKVGSNQSRELENLVVLVKEYENAHFEIPRPDPIEAIKFRMEQIDIHN